MSLRQRNIVQNTHLAPEQNNGPRPSLLFINIGNWNKLIMECAAESTPEKWKKGNVV